MSTLVCAGPKINSYAVAWEKIKELNSNKIDNRILILDPAKSILRKYYILDKILSKSLSVKPNFFGISRTIEIYYSSHSKALAWYSHAFKDLNWREVNIKENSSLPVGLVIESLLARTMGTNRFNLVECNKNLVIETMTNFLSAYELTVEFLKNNRGITQGYVCGGRDAFSGGVLYAFKHLNLPCGLMETTAIRSRWATYEVSPHFSPEYWKLLEDINSDVQLKGTIEWWRERLSGIDHVSQRNWGATRVINQLPELPEKYITFYSSSEFEVPLMEEFNPQFSNFKDQFDALKSLVKFAEIFKIPLVIRRHPNSLDAQGGDQEHKLWANYIHNKNIIYIPPQDKCDSIKLASGSQAVFTFKSSIGAECLWIGIPTFAMGSPKWAYSKETRIWSIEELKNCFQNSFTQPKSKNHAIRWSNLMLSLGQYYELFEWVDARVIIYKARRVKRNTKLVNLIDYIMKFILKLKA
jgi:hypothetical protein